MADDKPKYSLKLDAPALRYAERYPSVFPRLREILTSEDPQLRRRVTALARAIMDTDRRRLEQLAAAYRLTRAESRVALHIIEGGDIASYARQAGVSAGTARTQLKSVFAKTGVSRQGELIKLGQSEL